MKNASYNFKLLSWMLFKNSFLREYLNLLKKLTLF